jgi:hypothetical protein
MNKLREDLSETETFGKAFRDTFSALRHAYVECSSSNWDGYGAVAASAADFKTAIQFLCTLPPSTPSPEISIDPDGEFAFDWYRGTDVLSVSIGHLGRLSYAAHFGRRRVHGTEYFADELPEAIAENLQKLFS